MTKLPLYAARRPWLYGPMVVCAVTAIAVRPAAAVQPATAPCATCIVPSLAPGQTLALPARLAGLDVLVRVDVGVEKEALAALQAIRDRAGAAGLHLIGVPASAIDRAVLELASRVMLDVSADRNTDADTLAFQLKTALTALRAGTPRPLSLGLVLRAEQGRALLERDLAAYVDVLAWTGDIPSAPVESWGVLREPVNDVAALVRIAGMRAATQHRQLWPIFDDVVLATRWLGDLAAAAPLLPKGLVPVPSVQLSCSGQLVATFMNPETLDTIALAERCAASDEVSGAPAGILPERVALSSGGALIRVPAAQDRVAEGVQVTAARQLSVDEIIARHQAAAARQAAAVRELIASGTMTLTFEAPGFPAPITISSQIVIYTGQGRTEIEQRAVRVNGIEFRGRGIPRLPIIEPERVASPPLAITLTDVYRYRLAGRDTIDGTPCYVVAFEPVDDDRPLFRGRAWIGADTFAMVKVAAAQTGLRGPIVSSEQIDEFRVDAEGRWLLARSDVRQIYEGAAYRTPIHRVMAIARQEVNPPEFSVRRAEAYASPSIMLRDTPEGFRYLRRPDPAAGGGAALREPEIASGSSRVRTLIGGVIVDPNITRPLPFAGLSYVDFDLLGTGAQLNAFFGGSYGQMAFSVPSLGGTRWQLAGRAFGIASSYNDRAFIDGREQYPQNIRQRPAHASVWLLRPVSPRISIRAGYDLDYTHFSASDITAPDFVVPAHQVNHGARLAIEGQRGGWNGSVWWNPVRRTGWRAWGTESGAETPDNPYTYEPGHRDFQRYGVTVSRSAVITPRLVARVEAAWMSGRDLDRFSRYAFGTFDNRLRGYPSALIRYDRGGALRNAVAWSPGRLVRLDGFLDTAYVRDPAFASSERSYTGIGAAIEAPAPFGTLIAVEWGYGIQGITADGGRGTQVIRVSGFKIF